MQIIKLQRKDLRRALDLVWSVSQEFEATDYSRQQSAEQFREFMFYKSNIEKFDSGELNIWGCKEKDELLGVIGTQNIDHISMLFVVKEHHRRGIARNLFRAVEKHCKDQKNIDRITVNSTPTAVAFYRCLGFKGYNHAETVNGISYTPMEYILS